MRVLQEILSPSVQDTEKANLGAQMFWICGDLQQSRRTGSKQERVENLLVVKGQRSQFVRKGEDHMHVGNRQQFPTASQEPFISRVGLALWAVAVATGVVRDGHGMAATRTSVPMAAERRRSTAFDGREHLQV